MCNLTHELAAKQRGVSHELEDTRGDASPCFTASRSASAAVDPYDTPRYLHRDARRDASAANVELNVHLGILRLESDLSHCDQPHRGKQKYLATVSGIEFVDGGHLRNELLKREPLPATEDAEIVFVHPFAEYLTNPEAYIDLAMGSWTFPFFYLLRDQGYPVALSTDFVHDKINISPIMSMLLCMKQPGALEKLRTCCKTIFCCADASGNAPDMEGIYYIKQNPTVLRPRGDMFFYLFEKHLKPRAESRGNQVANVAFLGCERNLHPALQEEAFVSSVREMGLEFRVIGTRQCENWSHYEDVDVVIAVRPELNDPYRNKPPSKLVNAWRGGVPMVAGHESAYEALGTDGQDVFFVRDIPDIISVLDRLRSPDRYARVRADVLARQLEYGNARIAARFYEGVRALVA